MSNAKQIGAVLWALVRKGESRARVLGEDREFVQHIADEIDPFGLIGFEVLPWVISRIDVDWFDFEEGEA